MTLKSIPVLILLLFLLGCNGADYSHSTVPEIEECRFLTRSIFCTDKRLNDRRVNNIIRSIENNQNLDLYQKRYLVDYFESNRSKIIKEKEFEIALADHAFFRGYFLTNPTDEASIENWMDERLRTLDKYINQFGRLRN